jgi:hypothetical protein
MKVSSNVSDDVKEKADSLISEINSCLENSDFTKAASRGEKLNKLFQ